MISLRPYQESVVLKARDVLSRGVKRFILVMSTGAGKSRTACHIIESAVNKGHSCIVLVNRDRLVKQWDAVMDELGLKHGVIQYGVEPNDEPIQIASVDSYVSRLDKKFDIVISDECQYSLGDNYRSCIEQQDGISIGLTATPTKLNGDGFKDLYDELIEGISMLELQRLGYLCQLDIYSPNPPDVDLEVIDGDFNQAQYMRKVGGVARLDNAVEMYRHHIDGKRTIIFAVNIADSKAISKRFTDSGIQSKCIHSQQSQNTQDKILSEFCDNEFKVLVSVNILSEGADFPWLEAAIDLAPTASLARYLQKYGRLLRTYPGKDKAVILDLAGSYWIHGAPWNDHKWSLDGNKASKQSITEAILSIRLCTSCGRNYNAAQDSCPYCNEPKTKSKRLIKEASGKLILVTEFEACAHDEKLKKEEQVRKEKEANKIEYNRRKKAAKTIQDYELIERDMNLAKGWAYINYTQYLRARQRYLRK